VNSFKSEQ
jgi:DNA polymerase delta subunit 1